MNNLPDNILDDFEVQASVRKIEEDLTKMRKMSQQINVMRGEVAKLEWELMKTINAKTWDMISVFIGLTTASLMEGDNNMSS